jgi:hypothetical protein
MSCFPHRHLRTEGGTVELPQTRSWLLRPVHNQLAARLTSAGRNTQPPGE